MSEIELVTEILMSISALIFIVWAFWQCRQLEREGHKGQAAKDGFHEVDVLIENGFQPASITVKARRRVRLNFTRKDASQCGEEVVIPEFSRRVRLAVNQTLAVDLMPLEPGEFEFTCGKNVCRGKLIVR